MSIEPLSGAREVADLLRVRRERLSPADVGLPEGERRRTRGLRREEVAQLAAISPDYYTFLEQGRELTPSREVLDALAAALRMSPAERTHLHELVHGTPPAGSLSAATELAPAVAALVARQDPHPAYVKNRYWDVLAANRAARALFAGWAGARPGNVIWWMLCEPAAREIHADWEPQAQAMLARFRMVVSRHPEDARLQELRAALLAASPEAAAWWERHEVDPIAGGRKRLVHPRLGLFDLEHVVFALAEDPDAKLVVFDGGAQDEARLRELAA